MNKTRPCPQLFGGVDSISLDTRPFDISKSTMNKICHVFNIGDPESYTKEKGILVSHSNFFVHCQTSCGTFAIKFYPRHAAADIHRESHLNRLLLQNAILTPPIFLTTNGAPFLKVGPHLATCSAFIDGKAAYKSILSENRIKTITKGIAQLKHRLVLDPRSSSMLNKSTFEQKASFLLKNLQETHPFEHEDIIKNSLSKAMHIYKNNTRSFIQNPLHNNISLSNLLFFRNKLYILDLSHIQIDYELNDLASLIISSIFLGQPVPVIKKTICHYFRANHKSAKDLPILTTFILLGLVREFLKTEKRHQLLSQTKTENPLEMVYTKAIASRKTLIKNLLITLTSRDRVSFYPAKSNLS